MSAGDTAGNGAAGQLGGLLGRELSVVARNGVFQGAGRRAEIQRELPVAGVAGQSVDQSTDKGVAHSHAVHHTVVIIDP